LPSKPAETILPQESASEWINGITWPFFILAKNSKRHFIPHMILVQMIYKRSRGDKMAAKYCQNKDGLLGKEGAELYRFVYGEFFNIQEKFLGYINSLRRLFFCISQ